MCFSPSFTIQGVLLMSLTAEAWRAPAAGDIYGTAFMALFLAGNRVLHELTEAEKTSIVMGV